MALLAVAALTLGVNSALRRTQQVPALGLPDWVLAGSEKIQMGYIAAGLHAAELDYIPCFCGCDTLGHAAVVDCFIRGTDATGAPVYDRHAYY